MQLKELLITLHNLNLGQALQLQILKKNLIQQH